jgi:hypothetical protein
VGVVSLLPPRACWVLKSVPICLRQHTLTCACCLPPAGVRSAAAFAIGEFALYLQPEIVEAYEQVLPAVFYVMHDPTPEVSPRPGAAWGLLEVLCSGAH